MSAMHPVREVGGRKCHVRAFEIIVMGSRPRAKQDTLRWLQEHGLIEGSYRTVTRDAFGEVSVVDWSVPPWASMQWCAWAAEQK